VKGGRILVIDDEPMVREAVGRMLVADEGYAVDLAGDGAAALERSGRRRPTRSCSI
jgi:DNA-binding response OmpR family regulator